jgi:hypothetical protein
MDKHAQTCADWARTGEPKTAYSGMFPTFNHSGPELTLRQSPRPLLPSASASPTFANLPGPRLKHPILRPPRLLQPKAPAPARPMLPVITTTTMITMLPATGLVLSPLLSILSLVRPMPVVMPLLLALALVPSWLPLLLSPLLYRCSNDTIELKSGGVDQCIRFEKTCWF